MWKSIQKVLHFFNIAFPIAKNIKYKVQEVTLSGSKKNFMNPFYGWGSNASRLKPFQGGSLLFLISQKFMVLILSISEGWKAESTLVPCSSFEHGTPGSSSC